MNRIILSILILIPIILNFTLSATDFDNDNYQKILYFDLRNDNIAYGGFILKNKKTNFNQNILLIPFKVTQNILKHKFFYSIIIKENFSFFSYWENPKHEPYFEIIEQIEFNDNLDNETLTKLLYNDESSNYLTTLCKNGLERIFSYSYENEGKIFDELREYVPSNLNIYFDTIAVGIPNNAKRQEIKDGEVSIPNFIYNAGNIRYYPNIKNSNANNLRIKYVVPPTEAQLIFVEYLTKAIIALIPTLISLFFIKLRYKKDRRNKIKIIVSIVGIQILLIITIIISTIFLGWSITQNYYLDLLVGVLSAIALAIVLFYKNKAKT